MKILAIESSVPRWSVALLNDETVVAQPKMDPTHPISGALFPSIEKGLADAAWTIGQIECIAVTRGPGSFTGLRVGITAAKTLAFALGCPLVACNSLELIASIAAQARQWEIGQSIWAIMDAQRSEFFVGLFRTRSEWDMELIHSIGISAQDALAKRIAPTEILTGPGLLKWSPSVPCILADRSLWLPNAADLGRLGFHQLKRGFTSDPFALVPEYYRPSYAEEKKPGS